MSTGGALNCQEVDGRILISGVALTGDDDHRWCVYQPPFGTDEDDRWIPGPMPGADGARSFPAFFAPTRYLVPLLITGHVDQHGDPIPADEAHAAMQQHRDHLRSLIVGRPTPPGDGTRPITFITPYGDTWTSAVVVHRFRQRTVLLGIWDGEIELTLMRPWTIGAPS